MVFDYPPTAEVLQWLAAGRLGDRLLRSLRLYILLYRLYGPANQWTEQFSSLFRYKDLKGYLFAPSHGQRENLSVEELTAHCDQHCICQHSLASCLIKLAPDLSMRDWQKTVMQLTGIAPTALSRELNQCPFATVHRSIRADLNLLAKQGWLEAVGQGQYRCRKAAQWPIMPTPTIATLEGLSTEQRWEILRALESIAFVQPNLEVVVQILWEQLTHGRMGTAAIQPEPEKRIFIHLDYILSETTQERIDTLQEQIERLWQEGGGVIQFDYWLKAEQSVPVQVYPVCLHYARRAKYLSAYGDDPIGQFGWHNYRLDRIASSRLQVLPWSDTQVSQSLRHLYEAGDLPTPTEIEMALEEAWGFNFYLPRQLLIMRFPSAFARWYVDETDRHKTFQPIPYSELPQLLEATIEDAEEREEILRVLRSRPATDTYYRGWIRLHDINIVMRLRDWRPNGEVIAPLGMRSQMRREVLQEIEHYSEENE